MAPISLQDLRRRLYVKAKADKDWRFWGLYVHVAKLETLRAAYDLAKRNNGAPGLDGVTFEAIEAAGVDAFLVQLQDELVNPILRGWVNYFRVGNAARCLGSSSGGSRRRCDAI
jgi:Group II intron, maturase-specific domain